MRSPATLIRFRGGTWFLAGRRLPPDWILALAVGVAAGLLSIVADRYQLESIADIDIMVHGSRELLRGGNPYHVRYYFYPLPATVALAPLAFLSTVAARAVFAGVSFGLLTYAIQRTGRHRAPMLLCLPVLGAIPYGQWGALLVAAYLLPGLAWIFTFKPQFALPFVLSRPIRKHIFPGLIGGAFLVGLSFAVFPGWPREWLRVLSTAGTWYRPLLLAPAGGPLLALALLYWRDPDARLLFGLACIPQTVWTYNSTPLFLTARTADETARLTVLGWAASTVQIAGWALITREPWRSEVAVGVNVLLLYMPTLWMIVRRNRQYRVAAEPVGPEVRG